MSEEMNMTENTENIENQPTREVVADESIARMGSGPIAPLVREFAIPAILGMVVNGAYQIIDSVFLGWGAGEIGLSAITVASPIMTIIMATTMLIGAGGNALCALRLGEGKKDEAEHILGSTLLLGIIVSAFIAVLMHIGPCVEGLLSLSSSTDDVRPYARAFIQIISLGCVFSIVGGGLNNFIRTAGNPNRALVTMVIGAVGCTVFNALFVLVLGWGVVGSAWATLCGQALTAVSVLWYFLKTPNVPIKLYRRHVNINFRLAGSILALGMASFAIQMGSAVFQFVNNYVLAKYGAMSVLGATSALAVSGVVGRVAVFVILPLVGVSIAVQPLLGFNYGAKLWWRVRKTLFVGIASATVMATIMWAVSEIFAPTVVNAFGITDAEVVEFAALALRLNMLLIPFVGAQIVGSNYFQATGQPTKSIILSLTRQILFLVPCLLIMPEVLPGMFPGLDALTSVFIAMPTADFLACFTTAIFDGIELGKLGKLIAADPAAAGVPEKQRS